MSACRARRAPATARRSGAGSALNGSALRTGSCSPGRESAAAAGPNEKRPLVIERPFQVRWWSWRELNPRPQAFSEQFYMFSDLIWFSPPSPRSRTLRGQPVPYFLVPDQGTRSETSQCNDPCSQDLTTLTQPIGQLLQGSPAIKRRGRNVRRSQLVCFSWINEGTEPRHALLRVRTHVETGAAPGERSLSHRAGNQVRRVQATRVQPRGARPPSPTQGSQGSPYSPGP
jgi:hypothetical protein